MAVSSPNQSALVSLFETWLSTLTASEPGPSTAHRETCFEQPHSVSLESVAARKNINTISQKPSATCVV